VIYGGTFGSERVTIIDRGEPCKRRFLTPPFAFALFTYARLRRASVTTSQHLPWNHSFRLDPGWGLALVWMFPGDRDQLCRI